MSEYSTRQYGISRTYVQSLYLPETIAGHLTRQSVATQRWQLSPVKIGKLNHGIHGNHGTSSNPWVSSMVFFEMPRDFWGIPIFHPHFSSPSWNNWNSIRACNDHKKRPPEIPVVFIYARTSDPTWIIPLFVWTSPSELLAVYLEKLRLIPQSNSLTRNLINLDLSYHVISLFRWKLGGPLFFWLLSLFGVNYLARIYSSTVDAMDLVFYLPCHSFLPAQGDHG